MKFNTILMCTLIACAAPAFARVEHIILKVPANKPFTITLPGHPITPDTINNFWEVAQEPRGWCGTAHYSTKNRTVLDPKLDQTGTTGEEQFIFNAPEKGEKINLLFRLRGTPAEYQPKNYFYTAESE